MQLTFLGATGTVTGSKYLLHTATRTLLIDCGLFQGYKELRLRNWSPLPVKPREIDAVVLTHAHIDHSGYLPLLVKNGFAGRVYCSAATRDLCAILLPDSGHLQEAEARYANQHAFSRHKPALPLYTAEEAKSALTRLAAVEYEAPLDLGGGLTLKLRRAGHMLGASLVEISDGSRTILFSGDLGRPNDAIMQPPARVTHADYLVVESTYGNRLHAQSDPRGALAAVITRTAQRRGVVVIPAFAVGRAQTLLYHLHALKTAGRMPDIPVFLNSPMAVNANTLYHRHTQEHRLTREACDAMCASAQVINSVEESMALNERKGPMVIISASGMATGGRVLHHLKRFAPDARNTILFAGFQAGGTRGASIVAGAETVKIHGAYVPIRAEVAVIDDLSAHADAGEIIDWLRGFTSAPRQTFITHGEPAAADALRIRVTETLRWPCMVPGYRDQVTLT